MKELLSVTETAEILGASPQAVRIWIKSGNCPFGSCAINKGNKATYFISRHQLMKYIGKKKAPCGNRRQNRESGSHKF